MDRLTRAQAVSLLEDAKKWLETQQCDQSESPFIQGNIADVAEHIANDSWFEDGAIESVCEWRAGGCQTHMKHVVVINQRNGSGDKALRMCTRCASVFDPALGAYSGHIHDFRYRIKIA